MYFNIKYSHIFLKLFILNLFFISMITLWLFIFNSKKTLNLLPKSIINKISVKIPSFRKKNNNVSLIFLKLNYKTYDNF